MKQKELKELIGDPRINVSGICKGISKKGLSRASLLNKLNDNHSSKVSEEDIEVVRKELKKLSLHKLEMIE